ncbi:MAG: hypothetical protein PHE17_00805 [Thiothrix sp.]|uniref:hypothetical protein n=1 Tax=Thiothrix sp. TaxID=1032 RepID=UPI00261F5CAA|nr:hypothetical protein [Thiothrix sp.]MDD5391533.1 hypothetical protein [Thiothrix sp.]
MKKTTLISTALVAGVLFASSAAMAAPFHGGYTGVNVGKLEQRIDMGVRSGDLTRGEESQLRGELRRLVEAVRQAKRDHRVTAGERNRLDRQEASLNRHIFKLSNNRDVARRHDRRDDRNNNWSQPNGPQPGHFGNLQPNNSQPVLVAPLQPLPQPHNNHR